MKTLYLMITLSIGCILIACREKPGRSEELYELKQINSISTEEAPEPPPPDYQSKFQTIEEWLSHICDKEHPDKSISTFLFDLFEQENKYTLCLTGIKTHKVSEDHIESTIAFAPADMYYLLPANEYKDLKREQALERITNKLRAFAKTEKFRQSFFNEAKSITTNWNGERVVD